MVTDDQTARPRDAEMALAQARSLPKPAHARLPPTRQTARKGRLNFLYLFSPDFIVPPRCANERASRDKLNALPSIAIQTSDPSTPRRALWMAPRWASKNCCTIFSACMTVSETIDPVTEKKLVMHVLFSL